MSQQVLKNVAMKLEERNKWVGLDGGKGNVY